MKSGDPIWYRQLYAGGYGHDTHDVAGVFLRTTPRRVTVRIWSAAGVPHDIVVAAKNVRPRKEIGED